MASKFVIKPILGHWVWELQKDGKTIANGAVVKTQQECRDQLKDVRKACKSFGTKTEVEEAA